MTSQKTLSNKPTVKGPDLQSMKQSIACSIDSRCPKKRVASPFSSPSIKEDCVILVLVSSIPTSSKPSYEYQDFIKKRLKEDKHL